MSNLYVFTTNFPYGKGEEFFEDEIIWLARHFEHIYIVPALRKDGIARPMPPNCELIPIKEDNGHLKANLLGLFDFRTIGVLMKDFFCGKVYHSLERFKMWRDSWMTLNQYLHQNRTKKLLKQIRHEDTCYSYWGKGWTRFYLLLKQKPAMVSRFHGFGDLWEESYGGYMTLRKPCIDTLDRAVLISPKGQAYFKKKYPDVETCIFRLGSKDYGVGSGKDNDDILKIVSCSTIYPLKRVHLIFQAINNIQNRKVEWTHIGNATDNVYFNELKCAIDKECNPNLKVNLLGYMPHEDVLKYYMEHHFDVFVNLSTLEGVPVSIMEAESFGIPVVATDVGCTCDAMSDETGVLVSGDPSVEEVTEAILKVSKGAYHPREFWREYYNADVNYDNFAKMLQSLSIGIN